MTSEPLKVTRLPEASRSDMRQDTYYRAGKAGKSIRDFRREQQEPHRERKKLLRQLLKACPSDQQSHFLTRNKATDSAYDIYWCSTCKEFRLNEEDRQELRDLER